MSRSKRKERAAAKHENNVKPFKKKAKFQPSNIPPLLPKNAAQDQHITSIIHDTIVFAIGAAGTGKTYVSTAKAADLFMKKEYQRIVLTRPTVECGSRGLGFLPGTLDEKLEPWLEPFKEALIHRLGKEKFECDLRKKRIEPVPLQLMRGRSFDNTIILVDEVQNCELAQLEMLLTRIGENSKIILNGDTKQTDLRTESPINKVINAIKKRHISDIDIINYTPSDCVRSEMCRKMIELFEEVE